MRALCGAIITAGALIGLGLTALGMGERYHLMPEKDVEGHITWIKFSQMDSPLMFAMVFLTIMALIGLGLALLGLAYHHERRHREHLHAERLHQMGQTPSTTAGV
jgi:hypothetical protein